MMVKQQVVIQVALSLSRLPIPKLDFATQNHNSCHIPYSGETTSPTGDHEPTTELDRHQLIWARWFQRYRAG
jgi:hypothetical protein